MCVSVACVCIRACVCACVLVCLRACGLEVFGVCVFVALCVCACVRACVRFKCFCVFFSFVFLFSPSKQQVFFSVSMDGLHLMAVSNKGHLDVNRLLDFKQIDVNAQN